MIKASELRIGNWVSTIDNKIECTSVKGFYGFPVNSGIINHNNNVNDFEYLISIPLTEDWLIKFGFSTTQWDNFNSYRLMVGDNDYTIVIYSDGNCEVGDIVTLKIKSVHQLQNLYFALTGEELELVK